MYIYLISNYTNSTPLHYQIYCIMEQNADSSTTSSPYRLWHSLQPSEFPIPSVPLLIDTWQQNAYRHQLTQLGFETVEDLLEVLEVILLLGNQLEILLFPGFDAQLQAFHPMLSAGQGCLYAVSLAELHDGVHTLRAEWESDYSGLHQALSTWCELTALGMDTHCKARAIL